MSNYYIHFFDIDHPFCEVNLYGGPPEYINSLTSLFLVFIGLFGIKMNPIYYDINLVYSSLIINGITSALYHFTNQIGWGLMDRFSMVMLVIHCYDIGIKFLQLFNLCSPFYEILRFFKTFFVVFLLTITGLHYEQLFDTLFGFFLGTLLLFVILVHSFRIKLSLPKILIEYNWKGIFLITLAGLFWILTEKFCHQYYFIRFLFGHAIWHVAVALGGYYLMLTPTYMYSNKSLKIMYKYNLPYLIENKKFEFLS
jgi:hypothetical protein